MYKAILIYGWFTSASIQEDAVIADRVDSYEGLQKNCFPFDKIFFVMLRLLRFRIMLNY